MMIVLSYHIYHIYRKMISVLVSMLNEAHWVCRTNKQRRKEGEEIRASCIRRMRCFPFNAVQSPIHSMLDQK